MLAAAVFSLAVLGPAHARPRPVPALTADQQDVVVEVVNDTFRLARSQVPPLALCLDVQTSDTLDDEIPPARSRPRFGRPRPRPPAPLPPVIRGAPQPVVDRLTRPWRKVASAAACRPASGPGLTLNDAQRTAAQLVTVRLSGQAATGSLRIEWTGATADGPSGTSSRDCSASRGPRGWAIRCGGTWTE